MGGLDPGPFTLRELWWMARAAWDKTALLAYLLAEPNRDPEAREIPYCANDFNPLRPGSGYTEKSNVMPYNPAVLESIQNMK